MLVAEGLTNAQIAEHLWISPGTVRRHLENVFAKLGVHTRTAAVARSRDTQGAASAGSSSGPALTQPRVASARRAPPPRGDPRSGPASR
jgi:hypothetical protein